MDKKRQYPTSAQKSRLIALMEADEVLGSSKFSGVRKSPGKSKHIEKKVLKIAINFLLRMPNNNNQILQIS